MANEAPKIARIASETVSTATAAADTAATQATKISDAGTTQIRTAVERSME